jgi:plasmid stabilization system protein ParE
MAFRVEVSAQAETDADSILEWLLAHHAGDRHPLDDAIASLATFPERCPVAPESVRFPFEVRQLLYGRKLHVYQILFTIEGGTVNVLHIRQGRRKPLSGRWSAATCPLLAKDARNGAPADYCVPENVPLIPEQTGVPGSHVNVPVIVPSALTDPAPSKTAKSPS